MRSIVGVLGILGAAAGAAQSMNWRADLNSAEAQAARAMAEMMSAFGGEGAELAAQLQQYQTASIVLLIAAIAGATASVLILVKQGSPKALGGVLIAAGILPIFFLGSALFGLPMTIAGLMALFLKDEDAKRGAVIKTGKMAKAEYADIPDYR